MNPFDRNVTALNGLDGVRSKTQLDDDAVYRYQTAEEMLKALSEAKTLTNKSDRDYMLKAAISLANAGAIKKEGSKTAKKLRAQAIAAINSALSGQMSIDQAYAKAKPYVDIVKKMQGVYTKTGSSVLNKIGNNPILGTVISIAASVVGTPALGAAVSAALKANSANVASKMQKATLKAAQSKGVPEIVLPPYVPAESATAIQNAVQAVATDQAVIETVDKMAGAGYSKPAVMDTWKNSDAYLVAQESAIKNAAYPIIRDQLIADGVPSENVEYLAQAGAATAAQNEVAKSKMNPLFLLAVPLLFAALGG